MNELQKINPFTDLAGVEKLGEIIHKSCLCGATNPKQGEMIATTCIMEGITPMEFTRTYDIIQNRLSMKADAKMAKFQQKGGTWTIVEASAKRACALFTYKANVDVKFEFTIEEAKDAKICFDGGGSKMKTNWARFPKNMLWARMTSNAVRMLCPEINFGIHTPEEVQDFTSKPMVEVSEVLEQAKELAIVEEDFDKECIDYTVCPFGSNKGVKWDAFSKEQLEKLLSLNKVEISDERYLKEITKNINKEI